MKAKIVGYISGVGASLMFLAPLAHAQEVTLDPTTVQNIKDTAKSIPDTGLQFVFSSLQAVFPYILTLIAIGIAIALIMRYMRKAH